MRTSVRIQRSDNIYDSILNIFFQILKMSMGTKPPKRKKERKKERKNEREK